MSIMVSTFTVVLSLDPETPFQINMEVRVKSDNIWEEIRLILRFGGKKCI